MKTKKFSYLMVAASMAFALLSTSCKKSSNPDTAPAPVVVTGVQITYNSALGNIITDNAGRALYFFSKDAAATGSSCSGTCLVTWLPFYQANPTMGTGLLAADFGVITRADGNMQTTYKGWPLYYNATDAAAGDVKGDGAGGGVWVVAKAGYTVMFANAQLVSLEGVFYSSLGVAGTGPSQYLTDSKGRTLYINTNDTFNQNHFTNTDAQHNGTWPVVPTTGVDDIPTGFDKAQFGAIATVTGGQQLTYKGRPLYYFGPDNLTKGNTKGISYPTPGAAIWRVANAATTPLQ
ncbi:hypothetical protein ACFGVR_22960 [Mucilaginibacter sp. AW1-3]